MKAMCKQGSCKNYKRVHRNILDKLLGVKEKYRCGDCGKVHKLR